MSNIFEVESRGLQHQYPVHMLSLSDAPGQNGEGKRRNSGEDNEFSLRNGIFPFLGV